MRRRAANQSAKFLNIFGLLDKIFCLIVNENLLLLNFLSRFFHLVHLRVLGFNSEQYFARWISVHLIYGDPRDLFVCLSLVQILRNPWG